MALRPVVITGIGVICAAGRDPEEFWARLTAGESGITAVADERFAAFEARYAGQVPTEWIDDQLPDTDRGLDRTARLALVAARQAVAMAGVADVPGERFGLVLGKCQATPAADGGYQPMHATGDVVAARLGMRGPRILVSTACAAGGNAVGLAKDKILTGEADVVLAGGVDPLLFGTYAGFAGLQALSSGPCAPYSRSDGLNLGEGAAFLVVEPLDRALARGAVPLAEVAGYGLSADAYHATAPDPTGRGGVSAMRRALADAGLAAEDVDYVNGHGTGTPANDAMEKKVMRAVFGERAASVPTSSIKSFIGHTLGAAGAVEAVASVLALRTATAPPTIGFTDEAIAASTLDFVPNAAREMPMSVVVSNNYAFGGNNAALVLRTPGPLREHTGLPERDVVVTGLGPVTGLGTGIAEVTSAIAAGQASAGPPSLDGRTFAPRSLWRHMNNLSRMAIAASRLAWEDAGLKLSRAACDAVGVMFATAAGSVESTDGFDESVLANPNKPAVLSFSNVVLNATGGAVCQTLGLRGPTTTICNGGASASIALDCAVETIRAGKAEVVLVVAADEAPETGGALDGVTPYDRDSAPAPKASAAVALVVESAEHAAARGATPYARVVTTRHAGAGDDGERGLVERNLSGLPADIDLVIGSATGARHDADEAAAVLDGLPSSPLTASTGLTGDCGSATGALNLALAALAIRDGVVTAIPGLENPHTGGVESYVAKPVLPGAVRRALVLTAAPGSVRGGVVLGAV
ncbi:beta-ketoacyl-[acyl-carrier-protein] synthase family protein [Actinokineospora sp. UTMC 2448]|uniref:beta-ketoacyl-[acyl-carrier-protein] synthase family protein n=1 Tax=Actinokineospora sp. UTMC 2448 TaxID=2268449 RepID=UPI002164D31F|nr:beta-ketoacyl-[acyl-carrier-protein] synthase family protein [Actinokineospora sp. UTMC 2448]UVS76690.1 3-oxoacyl-[acyl-carrier-protein] synthase 2 [Actinokineospora sp. UTMC 2448]